jgi:HEAT repeat protein
MEADSKASYQPPVDKLLTCGVNDWITPDKWPDYRELGIGPEHIPDLIQMATDEELNEADAQNTEVWAPMHAWRALGQLRAVEAVEPLLGLFDKLEDDDWVHEELPDVFGKIGPAALPALAEYMADLSHAISSQISAITSIEKIGKRWSDAKGECLALLEERLERFEENEPLVNGFLVRALMKMGAKKAAPLIERAFNKGYVDPMVIGRLG